MADIERLLRGGGGHKERGRKQRASEEEDGDDDREPDSSSVSYRPPPPLLLGSATEISAPIISTADLYTPVDEGYRAFKKARFTPPPATTELCYLCRYGDRIVDSGGSGSTLYAKMIALVEQYHTTKSSEELTALIARYVDTKIRPAVSEAVPPLILPAFDPANVLEHLTTSQHTNNSRMLCVNIPRRLERIMLQATDHIFPKNGTVDVRVMEGVRKMAETILKFHTVVPHRMAFGAARPDSLNIATDAPFSSASVTRRIKETQPSHIPKFLREFAEKTIADDDAD